MATESSINGNYAPHQGYGSLDQNQNHSAYAPATSNSAYSNVAPPTTGATTAQSSSSSASDIPKDEVGWYFVEQYYTTLSRSPEKLFLFYNKRSQYVSGNETEKVTVSVGQRAINDRIKELEFQDCKVRVTNVDSQASDQNIVIQVIGEISNKSAPHKKFTQTFVLAGQTNGYFVLNDIFRYIVEEEDEVNNADHVQEEAAEEAVPSGVQEPAPTAAAETAEPETLTSSNDPAAVEEDAEKVDKELLEKVVEKQPSAPEAEADLSEAPVNGTGSGEASETEAPAPAEAQPEPEADADAEATSEAPAAASEQTAAASLEPEKPKDPEPTPAASPPKPSPAQPAAAPAAPAASAKPAVPKSWASLAAAAHRVATPAVSASQPTSATPAQPKSAPAPVQPVQATPSAPSPGVPAREASPVASQQDEWTSVGGDHKRQQSKAQTASGPQEATQYRAYIKNVNETIEAKDLRAELEKYGELVYFDIARQKNCAFVDFKTEAGYKAALEANPHEIGNERVVVEERRLKPGSYPYVPRGGSARGGRGSSNSGNGRGSFQGGRGGFPQRGRGGNPTRGRGGAQAA